MLKLWVLMALLSPFLSRLKLGMSLAAAVEPASFSPLSGVDRVVVLDLGENIGPQVAARLRSHLSPWLRGGGSSHSNRKKRQATVDELVAELLGEAPSGPARNAPLLLVTLGNTTATSRLIGADAKSQLGPEGFVLATFVAPGVAAVAVDGNPMRDDTPRSRWDDAAKHLGESPLPFVGATGAITGAYAALESLGFGFFHPLEPLPPLRLRLPTQASRREESPRWPFRGWHVHTQHPLELTDVLQGFDIAGPESLSRSGVDAAADRRRLAKGERGGAKGLRGARNSAHAPGDGSGGGGESWEDMLVDVVKFFEWCAANRVNRVEWMLLGNERWGGAMTSPVRQERLRRIVALAHDFGLLAGADVPLAFRQQHAWYIVDTSAPAAEQQVAIESRCDWVAEAGFDFVTTESGLSEFTDPGDATMLRLMDVFATHVNATLGLPAAIKVHCSTNQLCKEQEDPRWPGQGRPLNFNYLPTYATDAMGVMAHTVQAYALDEPVPGVYGNANFSDMLEYMMYEAGRKRRSVYYYGETSYWVSVDVDVPLFLPVYGQRRLHDLRLIAAREDAGSGRIDGQMNFDSGWEWGGWLANVVTARAAWDPQLDASSALTGDSDSVALVALLSPVLSNAFGQVTGRPLADWLARLCEAQGELLLQGNVNREEESSGSRSNGNDKVKDKLTGMAYLSGGDTWLDLPRLLGVPLTQPDKVRFHETKDPAYRGVAPLLAAVTDALAGFRSELQQIVADYRAAGEHSTGFDLLLEELQDAVEITLLRSQFVQLLYSATAPKDLRGGGGGQSAKRLLSSARAVLASAQEVVARRERHYRAPLQRIAGWRDGPTAYGYGYLWAVHSLYYWWRDYGLAEGAADPRTDFCYLNRMDPVEIGFGWGKKYFQGVRALFSRVLPMQADSFLNCLSPPLHEYEFPRDLSRYSINFL